jgi:adenine-specific DNA-methyltransferase
MAHERLRPEYFFDQEKVEQLKQLAPECFEDGKINFDTLCQNLGGWRQNEEDPELEHFGLFWPGKREARRAAAIPPEGTLEPVWGEGLKADGTSDTDGVNDSKNIFIEGENLEVLKILQKSYAGKIKMIYIDPPYNTGNDFVYDDDFTEPLQEYLRRTGQVDEEGKPMTTNKRSDGRFHSKWLSMMYPRLRLARNLLREDGVIFVSIDDNEVHNLRAIMNEIFGEENFIAQLVWEKKKKGTFLSNTITNVKEYIIVYSFEKNSFQGLIGEINSEVETYPCINASNRRQIITIPKGILSKYRENNFILKKGEKISVTTMDLILHSDLIIRNGVLDEDLIIEGNWRYTPELMKEYAEKKEIYITQDLYLRRIVKEPRIKTLKDILGRVGNDQDADFKEINIDNLFEDGWGSNEDGVEELRTLFGIERLMDYPKPVKLISKLIASIRDPEAIILDFFAGSATTAQALYKLNVKDNGKRKFLLIQLPELFEIDSNAAKAGFCTISELAKKRIRNAISYYKELNGNTFKVYTLQKSNFKAWKNFQNASLSELEIGLELFNQSPMQDNWNINKLLYEIILIEGFPLDSCIQLNKVGKNDVYLVKSEMIEHQLLICLDEKFDDLTIQQLELNNHRTFICFDNAISTVNKLRLSDQGLIKTI